MSEKKLTLKQQRFIKEYIKTGNGAAAARKAGYSEHCAREIAVENLSKPIIKEKIESAMSDVANEIGLTAKKVLSVLNKTLDLEDTKLLGHVLRAVELAGKHLKLFHDTEVDVKLQHQEVIKQLEELE